MRAPSSSSADFRMRRLEVVAIDPSSAFIPYLPMLGLISLLMPFPHVPKEQFMRSICAVLLLTGLISPARAQWIETGPDVPELAIFDEKMQALMQELDIPSAQLALTWKGRLVLARGYSWNPGPNDIVVQPDSLFRIASVTKPITSVLVNRLIQDGLLSLDQTLGEFVDLSPLPGETQDPLLKTITIRNLLEHRAGLAAPGLSGYDPMFLDGYIASLNGVPLPVTQDHIRWYMNGVPLTSTPGTTYDYSNYGYTLLRQVVEAASGMSYVEYFHRVFNPIGIWDIRAGGSTLEQRHPNEVFYDSTGYSSTTVMDNSGELVPVEYGGFNMTNLEGVGGFVASAVEIARLLANLDDGTSSEAILNEASLDRMFGLYENYPLPYVAGTSYYALGWVVADNGEGAGRFTWHDGSLPGTTTVAVRLPHGLNYYVSLNRRNETGQGSSYASKIYTAIYDAYSQIQDDQWPEHDLFPRLLPVIFRDDFD